MAARASADGALTAEASPAPTISVIAPARSRVRARVVIDKCPGLTAAHLGLRVGCLCSGRSWKHDGIDVTPIADECNGSITKGQRSSGPLRGTLPAHSLLNGMSPGPDRRHRMHYKPGTACASRGLRSVAQRPFGRAPSATREPELALARLCGWIVGVGHPGCPGPASGVVGR